MNIHGNSLADSVAKEAAVTLPLLNVPLMSDLLTHNKIPHLICKMEWFSTVKEFPAFNRKNEAPFFG